MQSQKNHVFYPISHLHLKLYFDLKRPMYFTIYPKLALAIIDHIKWFKLKLTLLFSHVSNFRGKILP